jgi:hypothetical protein
MKSILLILFSITLASIAGAAEILYSKHQDENEFKRISEHFSGKENPGRYSIVRSDPSQRNGYYVALKLEDSDQADKIVSLRIQFVKPGSMEIQSQTLSTESVQKKRILVGLTDGDWVQENKIPTAWKIDFLDGQGKSLFHSQSFLWAPGATKSPGDQ